VGKDSYVLMNTWVPDIPPPPFDQIRPTVIPALQNRSILSIHIGDYHYGALTSEGELYTWGQYARGALGLGDPRKIPVGEPGGYDVNLTFIFLESSARMLPRPPSVSEPALVKFNRGDGKRRFCFVAAAAGCHFGALVFDTEVGSVLNSLKHINPDFVGKARP
jgi:SCF-associated factor 1